MSQSFSKSTIYSIGIRVASALLGFLVTLVISRTLELSEFGSFSFLYSLIIFLTVPAALGLPKLLVRKIAELSVTKQPEKIHSLFYQTNVACLMASAVMILLLIIYFQITGSIGPIKGWEPILSAAPLIALISLVQVHGAVLHGFGKVLWGQIPEFIIRPVLFIAALAALHFSSIEVHLPIVFHIFSFSLLIALIVSLFSSVKLVGKSKGANKIAFGEWLPSTTPFMLTIGMYMLNQNLDTLMLGFLDTPESVGLYRPPSRIVLLVGLGITAVNYAIRPSLSKLFYSKNMDELQKLISWANKLNIVFAFVSAVFLVLFGTYVLRIFGEEFVAAKGILQILVIGYFLSSFSGSITTIMNMTGHEKTSAKLTVLCGLMNFGLNFVLIPTHGAEGAAISTAITTLLWHGLATGSFYQSTGLKPLSFKN